VEDRPVDRDTALALARAARELWVKAGTEVWHVPDGAPRPAEDELCRWLVHEDGRMRVPVLVAGGLLVRGYTDALYRQALGARGASPSPGAAPPA
jgi:hypothetical protein